MIGEKKGAYRGDMLTYYLDLEEKHWTECTPSQHFHSACLASVDRFIFHFRLVFPLHLISVHVISSRHAMMLKRTHGEELLSSAVTHSLFIPHHGQLHAWSSKKIYYVSEQLCLRYSITDNKWSTLVCHHTNQTRFDYPNPSLV